MSRASATAFIIEKLRDAAGDYSADFYQKYLSGKDDKEFSEYIDRLESGEESLVIEEELFGSSNISFEKNLEIARSMGKDFYHYLIHTAQKKGVPGFKSAVKCLVLDIPVKRPSQMSEKKITAPTNYSIVNEITGQVTGKSKGASITTPEIGLLSSMGVDLTLEEAMKARGGDSGMQDALFSYLEKTGRVSLEEVRGFSTGVKSIKTAANIFRGMHINPVNMEQN